MVSSVWPWNSFGLLRPPGAARYWDTMEWSKDGESEHWGSDYFGAMLGPGNKQNHNRTQIQNVGRIDVHPPRKNMFNSKFFPSLRETNTSLDPATLYMWMNFVRDPIVFPGHTLWGSAWCGFRTPDNTSWGSKLTAPNPSGVGGWHLEEGCPIWRIIVFKTAGFSKTHQTK